MTDKPTLTDAEIIAVAATEGVRVRTGAAAIKFARAIEAEVRKQDEALIRQMLDALTAPYDGVKLHGIQMAAITAARARRGEKP